MSIRQRRKAAGLTMKDLAEILGITVSALSDVERGKAELSVCQPRRTSGYPKLEVEV